MTKLGIVTGMNFEAEILRIAAQAFQEKQRPLIVCRGLGRKAARRAAEDALRQRAGALLSFGIAAGLDPGLGAGTVVIASGIQDGARALPCSPPWVQRLHAALTDQTLQDDVGDARVMHGILAHAGAILATPEEKANLRAATGAAAADMESLGVAEVAERHALPFAALRVVADMALDRVPAVALTATTPDGRIDVFKSALGALAHPSQIPDLIRLGRHTDAARRTMGLLADFGLARSFFL